MVAPLKPVMEGQAATVCHHKAVCPLVQAWACPRRQATSRSTCSGEGGAPHQAATISTLSSGGRERGGLGVVQQGWVGR
jgi:hypothetical protein